MLWSCLLVFQSHNDHHIQNNTNFGKRRKKIALSNLYVRFRKRDFDSLYFDFGDWRYFEIRVLNSFAPNGGKIKNGGSELLKNRVELRNDNTLAGSGEGARDTGIREKKNL